MTHSHRCLLFLCILVLVNGRRDISELKIRATQAREDLITRLKEEYYGEYFEKLFLLPDGLSRGKTAFLSANNGPISRQRLKNKLMMKILREYKNGESLEKFVWVSGGHSAAAGHGNFHNQSYTAYMESFAKPVFASVGLDFEGRNYAMGGMPSSPEFSLCNVAIFGADADVISWDYGMTDGRTYWLKGLYTHRVGVHPNRPIEVDINAGGRHFKNYVGVAAEAENNGIGALYLDGKHVEEMIEKLPETMGMSQSEIDQLPPYVRSFKCQGKVEVGDPGCRAAKYTEHICSQRKGRVSWHPGYKMHALYGTLMAFFLIDSLLEALETLETKQDDPDLFHRLLEEEMISYQRFQDGAETAKSMVGLPEGVKHVRHAIYRHPVRCHTSILPSQERYLADWNATEEHPFDPGMPLEEAHQYSRTNGPMLLVYSPKDREQCPVELKEDYKDFFYTNENMGWSTMVISAFDKAVIVVCWVMCDWGQCPNGDVRYQHLGDKLGLIVNGVNVLSAAPFGQPCALLEREDGLRTFEANKDHRFEMEWNVFQNTSSNEFYYTRVTAVMLIEA